jgi:hypothetical protein
MSGSYSLWQWQELNGLTHAGAGILLLALCFLCGCPEHSIESRIGCVYSADCQPHEICDNGKCIEEYFGTTPDGGVEEAGTVTKDAGEGLPDGGNAAADGGGDFDAGMAEMDSGPVVLPPPGDAGPAPLCTPDVLFNDTIDSPYIANGDLVEGDAVSGNLCPASSEFFQFQAWGDYRLLYLVSWVTEEDSEVDLDCRYWGQSGSTEALYTGIGYADSIEAGSTIITGPGFGDHIFEVFPYSLTTIPVEGQNYQVQLRTGNSCQMDADCPQNDCVMPFFSPTGTLYSEEAIFSDGVCAEAFTFCSAGAADYSASEGSPNSSRSTAKNGFSTIDAWSCQFDVDYWKVTAAETGNWEVKFTNRSQDQIPGTFLVSVYDGYGNLMLATGLENKPVDEEQTISVPYVGAGTDIYIRVVQLNDDDFGAYLLSGTLQPATCDGTVCAEGFTTSRHGRTDCVDGACVCPADTSTPDNKDCVPPN